MLKKKQALWLKWIFLPVILILIIISKFLGNSIDEPPLSPLPISNPSPSPLVSPSPIPSPSPTPTPSPSPSPTPLPSPLPAPISSPPLLFKPEQIHGFIDQFSTQYNLDPNLLRHIAVCESGFNPLARNLTYSGLYQFSPNTWIKYRNLLNQDPDTDLRLNAQAAVQTAAYALSVGDSYIWPSCMSDE